MKYIVLSLFVITASGLSAQTKKVAKPAAGSSALKQSILAGQEVYLQNCSSCHQENGKGIPGLNPPLAKTSFVLGNKQQLINIVLKGLDKPLTINGITYTNVMPPLNYLSDKEVADVLTYVRNSFGNKASAVTATEVKATRAKGK